MTASPLLREAVVLRTTPYGDADVVVQLLVRGTGRLSAFARGARRSQKRFAGGLEPFGLLETELRERRGRDLWELSSSRLVGLRRGLRDDLVRLAQAGYATELVREVVRDHQPHDTLLDLLLRLYDLMEAAPLTSLRLRAFELSLVGALGLAPQLDACLRCASPVEQGTVRFDAAAGGVCCAACALPSSRPISLAALRLMRVLVAGGLEAGAADETHLPVAELRPVLWSCLSRHFDAPLRSRAFLDQVGAPT